MAEVSAPDSQRRFMSFDLQAMLESKGEYRRKLAALPIAEKLRILDALRGRELAIRGSKTSSPVGREDPGPARPASSSQRTQ